MKILLVEDDLQIVNFVSVGLKKIGYEVEHASDGMEGLQKLWNNPYDIAVIDIMMPKMDGITLIRRCRDHKITTPIIILSAKATVEDRVIGLESGADDYLVKPFAFSELQVRIYSLIRRASGVTEPSQLSVADLVVDTKRRKVFRGGEVIDLQPLEYSLLEYLIRNTGRVVSKHLIMEQVWEYHFDPNTNIVEARIYKLREKIDKPFEKQLLHTIRGVGYVLEDKN